MNPKKETIFSGKIESFISHELRNILAVIKENAGLMKDIISMSEKTDNSDKFLKILSTIENQVKSGEETTTLLNKFSHLNDNKKETFNVASSISDLLGLMKRNLKQKETNFIFNSFHNVSTTNSRFYFTMINYFIIEEILKNTTIGEEIGISCSKENSSNISYTSDSLENIEISSLEKSLAPYLEHTGIKLLKEKKSIIIKLL